MLRHHQLTALAAWRIYTLGCHSKRQLTAAAAVHHRRSLAAAFLRGVPAWLERAGQAAGQHHRQRTLGTALAGWHALAAAKAQHAAELSRTLHMLDTRPAALAAAVAAAAATVPPGAGGGFGGAARQAAQVSAVGAAVAAAPWRGAANGGGAAAQWVTAGSRSPRSSTGPALAPALLQGHRDAPFAPSAAASALPFRVVVTPLELPSNAGGSPGRPRQQQQLVAHGPSSSNSSGAAPPPAPACEDGMAGFATPQGGAACLPWSSSPHALQPRLAATAAAQVHTVVPTAAAKGTSDIPGRPLLSLLPPPRDVAYGSPAAAAAAGQPAPALSSALPPFLSPSMLTELDLVDMSAEAVQLLQECAQQQLAECWRRYQLLQRSLHAWPRRQHVRPRPSKPIQQDHQAGRAKKDKSRAGHPPGAAGQRRGSLDATKENAATAVGAGSKGGVRAATTSMCKPALLPSGTARRQLQLPGAAPNSSQAYALRLEATD